MSSVCPSLGIWIERVTIARLMTPVTCFYLFKIVGPRIRGLRVTPLRRVLQCVKFWLDTEAIKKLVTMYSIASQKFLVGTSWVSIAAPHRGEIAWSLVPGNVSEQILFLWSNKYIKEPKLCPRLLKMNVRKLFSYGVTSILNAAKGLTNLTSAISFMVVGS